MKQIPVRLRMKNQRPARMFHIVNRNINRGQFIKTALSYIIVTVPSFLGPLSLGSPSG